MARLLSMFICAVFVAGCASPSKKLDAVDATNIKSVIVIAALHDKLVCGWRGLTVFNNWVEVVPVDWPSNEQVRAIALNSLRGHYEIKPLRLDDSALDRLRADELPADGRTFDRLSDRLRRVVPPSAADAIVVFGGTHNGNASLSNSSATTAVVGILYDVAIYDGTDFKLKATAYSGREGFAPTDWRGEHCTGMSEAMRTYLQTTALATLDASVPAALRRAGLIR